MVSHGRRALAVAVLYSSRSRPPCLPCVRQVPLLCRSTPQRVVGLSFHHHNRPAASPLSFPFAPPPLFLSSLAVLTFQVHGVIYVVDSADTERLEESKTELKGVVEHSMIRGKPLLILANKQDQPSCLSEVDVSLGMGLDSLPMMRHKVVPCVARPASFGGEVDPRIYEGLRWLVSVIKTDLHLLNARVQEETEEFKQMEAERKKREAAERADPEAMAARAKRIA